jgi:Flagellar hook-length control protein FliK
MTAPAAALVSGAIAAPTLRAAPQTVTDRFAFGAMLDSLPGVAAKAGSSVAEEGSQTSNETKQEQSPSGQSDGHPMLGDGAFLSSLPFALQSGLAASQGPVADIDAAPLLPAPTRGTRLETSGASNAAIVNQAKPAAARLTGERAFHFAPSTSGVVSAGPSPTAGAPVIDAPSFSPAPAAVESETGALGPSTLAPLSMQGRGLTHDAALSPPSAVVARPSPTHAMSVEGAAPATGKTPAPVAARGAGGSANPPVSPIGAALQDPARGGRKAEAAASPSLARAASPAAPSAKAEPVDKADAGPPDQAALGGQPAPQGSVFGAPLLASVAGPSYGPYEAPAAADVVPAASAPALAAQAPVTAPVKEIDVDLSPGGLEDVSMTMRLSGDRLSVIIRAASSQTKGSIEGARDAIAGRLAAIGQPLDSLVIRQTGVNADANANGNGASADDSSTGGGRQSGEGAGDHGSSGDADSSRRGAGRDRSF